MLGLDAARWAQSPRWKPRGDEGTGEPEGNSVQQSLRHRKGQCLLVLLFVAAPPAPPGSWKMGDAQWFNDCMMMVFPRKVLWGVGASLMHGYTHSRGVDSP